MFIAILTHNPLSLRKRCVIFELHAMRQCLVHRTALRDLGQPVDCIVLSFTMKAGRNITVLGEKVNALVEQAQASWIPEDVVSGHRAVVPMKLVGGATAPSNQSCWRTSHVSARNLSHFHPDAPPFLAPSEPLCVNFPTGRVRR